MSEQPEFQLHPLAAQDITYIWEYIAEDSVTAASRVRETICKLCADSSRFLTMDMYAPTLLLDR